MDRESREERENKEVGETMHHPWESYDDA